MITITIKGSVGSGKTIIGSLITELLKKEKYNVYFSDVNGGVTKEWLVREQIQVLIRTKISKVK